MTANDDAYANAAHIPGGADYPARWAEAASQHRAREVAVGRARLNQPYGEGERQAFDLFYPAGRPAGLMVFVHGGYWRAFHRHDWSHLAAGGQAAGWAVAIPSYPLAPSVRIADITRSVARAVAAIAAEVPGPIALTGHSAGGHLVARMLCPDVALPDAVAARIVSVVPISPVADLSPLIDTAMNAELRLDAAEALAESPLHVPTRRSARVHVWVGTAERPAFVAQAQALARAWDVPVTLDPGRHHFDVIDGLADPGSPLMTVLLQNADRPA
ncbi:MAG: alpha/beta hydrolase fold domain-containing protein [Rhodobacteraceae bacterium]|jgi:acetyl esterase/lipase|nr:alpha/beta hydrolase fold domain-containing protein [Paracoccaceae bacterium]